MIDMKLNFNDKVEVYLVNSTCKDHIFQILAKETNHGILFIVTWDCINNVETSMF